MKKENPFGSAPINGSFSRIIFTDPQKEEEWDAVPDHIKKFAMKHLDYFSQKMTTRLAIEMLCHTINDLMSRIEKLENK